MRARHDRGFTLIELLITLAVLVVVMMIAVPYMGPFIQRQRVKAASMDIAATVVLARSEAIKRNAVVTVNSTAGTSDWSKGWSVTAGAATLRSQTAMDGIKLDEKNANASFSFSGDGRLVGTGMFFTAQTAVATTGQQPACIQVGSAGRIATTNGAC